MKRLLIVYNPRSSRAADVKVEVIDKARKLAGFMVGKYEIEKIGLDQNVANLAKILKDGDIVLSSGGDATGVIAVNAIMKSGRDVVLAVLPYGNFNDLARTLEKGARNRVISGRVARSRRHGARALILGRNLRKPSINAISELIEASNYKRLYPLEIWVDGKLIRYAMCYVTIGMMAEAVQLYDSVKMRRVLKSWWGRYFGSYLYLAGWYFKNRRKKGVLPEFKLNGELQPQKTSDYMAVNGKSMARVMKGSDDWNKPHEFRSSTGRFMNFCRLAGMMAKSMLIEVPGAETRGDVLEFVRPSRVKVQAEGESLVFENAKRIEIRKSSQSLKVIMG